MARSRHRHRSYPGGRGNRQVATALFVGLLAIALCCALIIIACAYFLPGTRHPAADAAVEVPCPALEIIGSQELNRDASATGPSLTDAQAAAKPVPGSKFAAYADARFLSDSPALSACYERMGFRYSDGDHCSVEHLLTQIETFGPGTLVFMDSGGAHSIAMATELGSRKGYQLVFKLGSRFDPRGANRSEQDVAAFRYHYSTFSRLKPEPTAPAVLVMDAHRGEKPLDDSEQDNSSPFTKAQFPKASEILESGAKRVVWILEGKTDTAPVLIDEALEAAGVFRKYEDYANNPLELLLGYRSAGLEVFRYRINPYDCPYSRRH